MKYCLNSFVVLATSCALFACQSPADEPAQANVGKTIQNNTKQVNSNQEQALLGDATTTDGQKSQQATQDLSKNPVEQQPLYDVELVITQENAIGLSEALNQHNDPNYGDMYITHKPYRIVVLFTDADTPKRQAWFARLPTKLKKQAVLKTSKYSIATADKGMNQISGQLMQAGVDFAGGFDVQMQVFHISVSPEKYDIAKQAMAGLDFVQDIRLVGQGLPVSE
ncbi:hypothetical protein [Moraxella nasicaprae]|uniref:Uncharacterized protein n=1 Tax=Moraxella nasicaprae TaxID=2904122 RepID=A0ABY6F6J1_9GAMM|nr:hypothetical protein [Moraxella nasicaprae]UXZ05495.1 hypothetical protein LU297_03350 [Moraxella nasicaprae]